jgi:serine/threonine protein kinase
MYDKILNEVMLLRELSSNQNIVKLIDYDILDNSAKIITEFGIEGTLQDYVNSLRSPLSEAEILSFIKQIANALLSMHSKLLPFAHRDVKMDKILKFGKNIKLCDLGSCSTLTLEPRLEKQLF